jgi:MFS family permease
MIRKRGIYPVLALGIFLQTLALLGASWSVEIWQLFLSQGLCFGFGMGFIFNATVGIIPQWFDRRRSFANALARRGLALVD